MVTMKLDGRREPQDGDRDLIILALAMVTGAIQLSAKDAEMIRRVLRLRCADTICRAIRAAAVDANEMSTCNLAKKGQALLDVATAEGRAESIWHRLQFGANNIAELNVMPLLEGLVGNGNQATLGLPLEAEDVAKALGVVGKLDGTRNLAAPVNGARPIGDAE